MLASRASACFHTEVVVIGAGVVGLAVTRALAQSGREVLVVERGTNICTETSSRNSEVIHAGLYYPPKSEKAIFCVRGKQMLYQYCKERGIIHQNCGKLVVATSDNQLAVDLPSLRDQALRNGVTDIRMLSREDVKVLEPHVECLGGILSPSTGVLDSHSFYLSLLGDCEDNGATTALRTEVNDTEVVDGKIALNLDGITLTTDTIINCGGLYASEIARKIQKETNKDEQQTGLKSSWHVPKHFFAKGTYFRLRGKSPFHHLIYPVPEPGGLGIHATVDWGGNGIKFGPDVEWLDPQTKPNDIDYNPDPSKLDKFVSAIQKYYPALDSETLVPDYVGVRPKLRHPKLAASVPPDRKAFDDFQIVERNVAQSRVFHLFGIESPGLTSSLAIGEHITESLNRNRSF